MKFSLATILLFSSLHMLLCCASATDDEQPATQTKRKLEKGESKDSHNHKGSILRTVGGKKSGKKSPKASSSGSCSAAGLEPPLLGVMPGIDRPRIILAQDVNYPPYATLGPAADDFPISGFGADFARGMAEQDACDLDIYVVQTSWGRCWGNDMIGEGLAMGEFHGCSTYTHSAGVRDRYLEFSSPILEDNKAAGILTRLDENSNPILDGNSDLSGRNVVDVIGWAPTADNLSIVQNTCNGNIPFSGYNIVTPTRDSGVANDDALRTLLDGDADAMWVYADQAKLYSCANWREGDTWDCSLWDGLGTTFAFIQTGFIAWARAGTTLSISKLGAGVADILDPCIQAFLETKSYYELCEEYDLTNDCFPNSFFPDSGNVADSAPYNTPTNELTTSCSDGYCPCPAT
jgi:hypothetical protein